MFNLILRFSKKFTFSLFLSGILFFSLENIYGQQAGKIDFQKLDGYIENAYRNWKIPGMAIAVVKDNKVVFARAYGVRNIDTGEPVDTLSLFGIASNTKAMTSAALAMLVDEGKISWDDKVQDYLPWFQLYNPYVSAEMTIRDLLCHRSGLKTFSGDLIWYGSTYSRDEVIRRARYLKPTYGFRAGYGYSNIMFLTAGQIIKQITDTTWNDFIKTRIFDPLGMKNTNTSIREFGNNKNIVTGHVKADSIQVPVPWVNWDNIAPAGAVNSCVSDMSKWIILQLNKGTLNGQKFFSPEASNEMWTVQNPFKVSDASQKIWPSKHFSGYGLGWSLYDYHGRKVVTHGGGLDGQISRVALVPEENFGLVILTNSINSLPSYLTYEILDRYFGTEEKDWSAWGLKRSQASEKRKTEKTLAEEENRIKNTSPTLQLEEFAGIYGGRLYGDAKVTLENGKLLVHFIPTPDFIGELTHWQYNTFRIKLKNTPGLPAGKVQFLLDENGKVNEMKVNIPNPDFDFTELKFLKKE
jgi:CubicO group peptidase (beta-lactamase class C family)